MLRLAGVHKRYGRGRWVLRDVDLGIAGGEVVAITGENGSGKSTLLRVLAGVARPTRGKVLGRPGAIGYVPDRFAPTERLSALAYLTHLGRIRGLSTERARARAGDLLERLALVGGGTAPLRTLSKGNAQKVAVAQALLVAPQLLVLDEPWSGLDRSAHGVLSEIIGEVAEAGGSVVVTDHRESITGTHASVTYAVEDGEVALSSVRPHPHRRQAVTVVLAGRTAGTRARSTDWAALDGVQDVTDHGSTVTIRVLPACRDALLRTALGRGWSVESVGRAAPHTTGQDAAQGTVR